MPVTLGALSLNQLPWSGGRPEPDRGPPLQGRPDDHGLAICGARNVLPEHGAEWHTSPRQPVGARRQRSSQPATQAPSCHTPQGGSRLTWPFDDAASTLDSED